MTRWSTVLLGCVILTAGCGTGTDRRDAREVVAQFGQALRTHSGVEACAQLSRSTVEHLESQEQHACPRAVTELDFEGGDIVSAEVYITNARVTLSSGESLYLERESEGWKLSAVGCRPRRGDAHSRPLDCEIEG